MTLINSKSDNDVNNVYRFKMVIPINICKIRNAT